MSTDPVGDDGQTALLVRLLRLMRVAVRLTCFCVVWRPLVLRIFFVGAHVRLCVSSLHTAGSTDSHRVLSASSALASAWPLPLSETVEERKKKQT